MGEHIQVTEKSISSWYDRYDGNPTTVKEMREMEEKHCEITTITSFINNQTMDFSSIIDKVDKKAVYSSILKKGYKDWPNGRRPNPGNELQWFLELAPRGKEDKEGDELWLPPSQHRVESFLSLCMSTFVDADEVEEYMWNLLRSSEKVRLYI